MAGALSVVTKLAASPGAADSVSQFIGLAKAFRSLVDLVEVLANLAGLLKQRRDAQPAHSGLKVAAALV